MKRDRVSIYIEEDIKNEWIRFAKSNDYSTLSKLMREAIEFYIEYKSKTNIKDKKVNLDLLSNLSHELKEPLTSLKAYLQFIIEEQGDSIEDSINEMARKALNQCLTLENKIVENLESFEYGKGDEMENNNDQYDILIIDDNVETVNFLITYFKRKGYTSKGVFSGLKSLKELKNHIPKVILLDLILPDISGYEVFKTIKTINALKEVPIFILTAIPPSEVEKNTQAFNPTGIIFKPFNLTDFKAIYEYLQ